MATEVSKENKARKPERLSNPFLQLQRQMDSVFEDFGRSWHWPEIFSGEGVEVVPSMEVHHEADKVTVAAELPGVSEEDIDLSVVDRTLTISGEKKSEIKRQDGDDYRTERSYGSFSRSVTLPFVIDADKVDAKFADGVLSVTVAKPADAEIAKKKIAIKH